MCEAVGFGVEVGGDLGGEVVLVDEAMQLEVASKRQAIVFEATLRAWKGDVDLGMASEGLEAAECLVTLPAGVAATGCGKLALLRSASFAVLFM